MITKKNVFYNLIVGIVFTCFACDNNNTTSSDEAVIRMSSDTVELKESNVAKDSEIEERMAEAKKYKGLSSIQQKKETEAMPDKSLRTDIVEYAATLEGIPYKEAGKDEGGFDCSGFVSYVFKEFDIDVPSSSRHMIEYGEEVSLAEALPGDVIFFTGTDSTVREVGHVGIVVSEPGEPLSFIHSSSSKKNACVQYSDFNKNYQHRYLKTKRIVDEEGGMFDKN